MSLAPDDPRHGRLNTYKRYRCRCERCRAVWAAYMREYTHRRGLHQPWASYLAVVQSTRPPHGTEGRYNRHGCRCEACKRASREARARRRNRVAA